MVTRGRSGMVWLCSSPFHKGDGGRRGGWHLFLYEYTNYLSPRGLVEGTEGRPMSLLFSLRGKARKQSIRYLRRAEDYIAHPYCRAQRSFIQRAHRKQIRLKFF